MASDSAPAWPPDLLDLRGLCHALSLSPKAVQRLLAAGRLPAADLNLSLAVGLKGRRWRRGSILAWLDAGRRGAAQ
jgi:predicted DNA-binding transcriptional regulator AlpA